MAWDAIRADNAQCGGASRNLSLLRSGCRQPARLFGHTSGVRCGDGRVSSGHDRRAANGEMDGGSYRGGRHRWPYAGRDGNSQGSLHYTGGLGNSVIATAELGGALLISFLTLAIPAAA